MKRAVAALATLTVAGPAHAFGTNGRVWPSMPVQIWINPTDCPEMANGDTIVDIVTRATAEWSSVVCAGISFEIVSTTSTATWARLTARRACRMARASRLSLALPRRRMPAVLTRRKT